MNEDFRVLPVKLSIDLDLVMSWGRHGPEVLPVKLSIDPDLVMSWGRHRPEVLPVKLSIDPDLATNEVAQTWSFIGKTLHRS